MIRLLTLLSLSVLASSCRYTSFPLIPGQLSGSFPSRFETAGFSLEGQTLTLKISLRSSDAGYLGILWYEDDKQVARDSVYLDADQREAVFRYPVQAGRTYRANLTFKGDVVRQFEYEAPAPAPSPVPTTPPTP